MDAGELNARSCRPYASDESPLTTDQAADCMTALHDDWVIGETGREISRTFRFANYYETMAFVNALAFVAHTQDHHPDIEVGYNRCHVRFSTHSIGGLSENDFICAAKLDSLLPATA